MFDLLDFCLVALPHNKQALEVKEHLGVMGSQCLDIHLGLVAQDVLCLPSTMEYLYIFVFAHQIINSRIERLEHSI